MGQNTKFLGSHISPRDFIYRSKPFICKNIPSINTSICHNIPSVGFNKIRGFNLIELIVTVAVASILTTIAAPNLANLVKGNQMTAGINSLVGDTMVARSEAVKRNVPVTICKSSNPMIANPVCNTTVNDPWSTGWIVFVDTDGNGIRATNGTELLLRQHEDLGTDTSLATADAGLKSNLMFRPNGRPLGFAGGTLTICDSRGAQFAKAIVFPTSGKARASKTLYGGGALSCS